MFAIKVMRERRGLGQQQAADALGVTKRRYGNWEREDREINLRDAVRLADLFECTLDELAGREWPSPSLTSEERGLVGMYRGADARGRDAIMGTAERESEASHREAPAPSDGAPLAPPGVA